MEGQSHRLNEPVDNPKGRKIGQVRMNKLTPPDIWHKQTRHSRRASFKVETDVIKSERSDTPGPTKAQARKDKWGRARSGKCC
jgi:hypothetical protein